MDQLEEENINTIFHFIPIMYYALKGSSITWNVENHIDSISPPANGSTFRFVHHGSLLGDTSTHWALRTLSGAGSESPQSTSIWMKLALEAVSAGAPTTPASARSTTGFYRTLLGQHVGSVTSEIWLELCIWIGWFLYCKWLYKSP